jgi:peptidoglycan/xylan/chitin deacetylase (PgdA/CDA1 family)
MAIADYWARARAKYYRSGARWLVRREMTIDTPVPLISFTFDDFPKSAVRTGGAILNHFGVVGTYYAALGLLGREEPSGPMFTAEDLEQVIQQGHELGCHTFAHCHSWRTRPAAFEESVVDNRRALATLRPGTTFQTFSYPICAPRPQTKRRMARYFACCRGGGQTFNTGTADLNYLSAFFLEKSRNNPDAVKRVIDLNQRACGWLIFATHDVCSSPSPYGCTAEFFEEIVRYAADSGARILPVAEARRALSPQTDDCSGEPHETGCVWR